MSIGNKAVYFQTGTKTVTPADDSLDIKLGNTSAKNVKTLSKASNSKGWSQTPLATFWAQRDGAATLSVGGLTGLDSNLPVYVLALPVSDTGAVSDVPVQVYAAQKPRKITTTSSLYYQELTAPEGYVLSSDKIDIEKSNLTANQTTAEKKAETVRNYRSSTPDLLNGDDHFAYVIGYEDGSVRPTSSSGF